MRDRLTMRPRPLELGVMLGAPFWIALVVWGPLVAFAGFGAFLVLVAIVSLFWRWRS